MGIKTRRNRSGAQAHSCAGTRIVNVMSGKNCKFWIILTVLLLCLLPALASAGSLTTFYNADSNAVGFLFNLTAIGADDLMIDSFDVNLTDENNPATIALYYREGGYAGFEHDASAWTYLGAATVTAMGKNNVTHLPVGGLRLTAGKTYGVYMYATDADTVPRFRYSAALVSPLFENEALRLSGGSGTSGSLFSGMIHDPRTWNGTVYYSVAPSVPATGDTAGTALAFWALLALAAPAAALWLRKRASRG